MCTSCPIITVSTHCRGIGHARGAKPTHPHMEMHIQTHTHGQTHPGSIYSNHLHIIAITGKYTEKVLGQADTKLQVFGN